MEKSFLIAGFGGQGVQTLGKVLAYAGNEYDLNVTFLPAYGGAMRGGTSNCTVVISDKKISSPARSMVDCVVALNDPSYKAFMKSVLPGGTLIVNSDLIADINEIEGVNVVKVPANQLAQETGNPITLNVVMTGFLIAYTEIMPLEIAKEEVVRRLAKKEEYIDLNKKAFDIGVNYALEIMNK